MSLTVVSLRGKRSLNSPMNHVPVQGKGPIQSAVSKSVRDEGTNEAKARPSKRHICK